MDTHLIPGRLTRTKDTFQCEVINYASGDSNSPRPFSGHPPKRRPSQVQRSSSVVPAKSDSYFDEREIYELFCSAEGVCGFVDDFKFWQDQDYHYSAGKPMWLDLSDPSIHHIIFDDNIRVTDIDSIVDVRVFEGDSKIRSLKLDQMKVLEDVCLVQADLLQSTEKEDYFIEKLKICERNYDRILKQGL